MSSEVSWNQLFSLFRLVCLLHLVLEVFVAFVRRLSILGYDVEVLFLQGFLPHFFVLLQLLVCQELVEFGFEGLAAGGSWFG